MGEHINKDDNSLEPPSMGRVGGGVLTVAVIHKLSVGEEG